MLLRLLLALWQRLRGRHRAARDVCRVWLTRERKLAAVCAEIRQRTPNGLPVLVVAHFPKTLDALESGLRSQSIPCARRTTSFGPLDLVAARSSEPRGAVLLLSDLLEPASGSPDASRGDSILSILVVETYPVTSRDRRIDAFVRSLAGPARISPFCSLDEPLFRKVGGDRVTVLLRALGLREEAPIEHPAVAAAIERAQSRIEKKAIGDSRCDSAEDWFRYYWRE